jgi:Dolichyl-phosphate-mannose-protein mannosyltransferase
MIKSSNNHQRLARVLLITSGVLLLWALAVTVTGGFRIDVGSIRISSRNASRIFLFAALPAALAWRLAYRDRLEVWLQARRGLLRKAGPLLAAAAALGLVAAGVLCGSRTAAASDPSGYVSQSALWARGHLEIDQRFASTLPWPNASQSLTPLGYRIAADGAMVPTYAPGVPLLMALGRQIGACGPYLVGPISGALLVLFTFQLGRRVFGTAAATIAAILVACSPVVVFMSLVPMADVPAATFWVGALAVAVGGSAPRVFAAGIFTAIAILIRPNLVPLAVFPWLMVMVRTPGWRDRVIRTALFAAASIPGALGVAWINNTLYGSPLTSGYGDLGPGFALGHAGTNLRRYPAWWLESQGPFAFVFLAAFWFWRRNRARRREFLVLAGFASTLWLLYLFYLPFEAWWFLRFLVPAVPFVFLLCADAVAQAARQSATVRVAALAALTVIVASHVSRFIDTRDILGTGKGERRYLEPALHLASTIPPDAVIVAMQHSGSLRYYTGRLILRWDELDPSWLDRGVAFLRARGIATYLVSESWEEEQIRSRFAGQQTLADLDRGPIATARGGDIRIYQLQPPDPVARPVPVEIPISEDRTCHDISPDFIAPRAVEKLLR